MPELNPKTIRDAYVTLSNTSDQMGKFIRYGRLIYYSLPTTQHLDLIQEAGLTNLDDHGFLGAFRDSGVNYLTIFEVSTGLNPFKFPVNDRARLTTYELIKSFAEEVRFNVKITHEL